jgi:hypothetical protein
MKKINLILLFALSACAPKLYFDNYREEIKTIKYVRQVECNPPAPIGAFCQETKDMPVYKLRCFSLMDKNEGRLFELCCPFMIPIPAGWYNQEGIYYSSVGCYTTKLGD